VGKHTYRTPEIDMSDNAGGLNGSTQHLLEAHAQGLQQLRIVRRRDSSGTVPCLGLIEYSRTDRFSGGSIVGSTD
jgi:hypothetical protein